MSRIRQVADQPTTEGNQIEDDGSDLRAVVAYLRNEKEIVDLQLELHKQENMRLKSQIEHLTRSLDETRTSLAEVYELPLNMSLFIDLLNRNVNEPQILLFPLLSTLNCLSVSISLTFYVKAMLRCDPNVNPIVNKQKLWKSSFASFPPSYRLSKRKSQLLRLNFPPRMLKCNVWRPRTNNGRTVIIKFSAR